MANTDSVEYRVKGLNIINEPDKGERDAGLGVRYQPRPPIKETEVVIEQLWGSGDTERVYVGLDDLDELIAVLELIRVVRGGSA